jgi:RimJ/RimL family protein N-acetyltransferase
LYDARMTQVPTLETARLTMRGHQISDYADCVAMWSDPAVVKHIGGRPFGADETWTKLVRAVGHWQLLGFGYWVVHEKGTGRFVGEVGFGNFKRDLQPPFGDSLEAGWALAAWSHGKGYATEAVQAAIRWADDKFPGKRMVCLIDPDHPASFRVAEKCGFKEYARTTYKGSPTVLLERKSR